MKSSILSTALFILLLSITSCEREGSDASVTQAMSSGTWKVTLFSERGNDETTDFSGYTFTFNDNGTLVVVKNAITTTGSWSYNSSSNKFNIDLGIKSDLNKPLGELTDDWKIISKTDTGLSLTDDNPASAEFLTFSKN